MNSHLEHPPQFDLLNTVGENIFVTNKQLEIIFINDYADQLISTIGQYIHVEKKEQLYGKNLKMFHRTPEKQENILIKGPFPYKTTINLFNQYTANIVVNPYHINEHESGFILTWKDVTNFVLEQKLDKCRMEEMYTPVIETSIDKVLLVPIAGTLTDERLPKMKEKIVEECYKRHAEQVIIDFTGVTKLEDPYMISELASLVDTLSLIGTKAVYAGMSVTLVQNIIKKQIIIKAETFHNFKQAMHAALQERGYQLIKK